MTPEVTVVDYGLGNLFSVCRALEHCGATPVVSADPDVVARADRILLPGVGAFGDGMAQLTGRAMDGALKQAVARGAQLLGVCLGMQFLLDSSDEFGLSAGLGLIPGRVIAVPGQQTDGTPHKIPHIGWNALVRAEARASWAGTVLEGLPEGTAVYFVHSFMAVPDDPRHRIADCLYGGHRVAAVIGRDNVWGTQFHPEKSGTAGLTVLRRFIALS